MDTATRPFGAKTLQEVATELGASLASIRRYCRAGKLRAVKVGRHQLVLPDELRRFLSGDDRREIAA